jgi:uncharacterized protein YPO0396
MIVMLVKIIINNGFKNYICEIEECRLTKKKKTEIKERMIAKHRDLGKKIEIKNSEVRRLNEREVEELKYYDPKLENIIYLD